MTITPDQLFALGNSLALLGWLILILAPRRWPLLDVLPRLILPTLLAFAYVALILPNLSATDGDFGTIDGIRRLFASDALLAAGWIHYLAFDLFIGGWIADRSDEAGLPRLVQAPILLATFLLGPIGLLLFLLTRLAWTGVRRRTGEA